MHCTVVYAFSPSSFLPSQCMQSRVAVAVQHQTDHHHYNLPAQTYRRSRRRAGKPTREHNTNETQLHTLHSDRGCIPCRRCVLCFSMFALLQLLPAPSSSFQLVLQFCLCRLDAHFTPMQQLHGAHPLAVVMAVAQ